MPSMKTNQPRVWFITGSSAGIGSALVEEVLSNGDYVVATARKPEVLKFKKATPENFVAARLDLVDSGSITEAFMVGVARFGRIDVVVNNGGFGLSGPFEDLSDNDIKQQMDVNFTGVLLTTRAAIKVLRTQSPPGGLITQVTSIAGRIGMPWMSMYAASKFALEGFTESVAGEMDPAWNIKFNCVEPGGFRTEFFTRSMVYTNAAHTAYNLDNVKKVINQVHADQKGDPPKGAKAIYELATRENPPFRSILGSDAYGWLEAKLKSDLDDHVKAKDFALATDVDE